MIGLLRAAVGVVVDVPLSMAADVVTLGGAVNERENTYTGDACRRILKNVEEAVAPEEKQP